MKKKISKHISYKEATNSATAKKLKIDNTPTDEHLKIWSLQLRRCLNRLESMQDILQELIASRSPELNKAIRGSSRSSHMIGAAIDLNSLGEKSNKELFDFIMENLTFDQLIWEFGSDKNPKWIHISYIGEKDNRNEVLKVKRNSNHNTYYKIK